MLFFPECTIKRAVRSSAKIEAIVYLMPGAFVNKQELIKTLEKQLRAVKEERLAARAEPALQAARTTLKRYQGARLAATHADLLAAPDSHDAAEFFLNELYGSNELGQRDVDLERVIPTMQRALSYESLHAITEAISLDALSERLDSAMARELGPAFTDAEYAAAYRRVGMRADRERQLRLIARLGRSLSELVEVPLLALTLAAMRVPARLAGFSHLQQFLERGFNTFRKLDDPRAFVATIVKRERTLMAALYAG
jgi:hypothetical protein